MVRLVVAFVHHLVLVCSPDSPATADTAHSHLPGAVDGSHAQDKRCRVEAVHSPVVAAVVLHMAGNQALADIDLVP